MPLLNASSRAMNEFKIYFRSSLSLSLFIINNNNFIMQFIFYLKLIQNSLYRLDLNISSRDNIICNVLNTKWLLLQKFKEFLINF